MAETKKEVVNTEKKEGACCCACGCKCKWAPHKWFKMKTLAIIAIVLFYVALALTLWQIGSLWYYVFQQGAFKAYWSRALLDSGSILIGGLLIALGFLTVAKVLKALKKIKHAVVVKEQK